jgi:hypothetical protein
MNLDFIHLLPETFSPNSRVWIYQSSRLFTMSEALEIEALINKFCGEWQSHGDNVKAYGNLFFGQFLVLMADESQTSVGGCSTDSSVRFVKQIGQQFNVDFFDRNSLAFVVKDKVQILPMNQLQYAFQNNFIDTDTLYFNNTVLTKSEMESNWIIPIKSSWIARKLKIEVGVKD